MKMKTKIALAAGIGAAVGGLVVATYYEKDRYQSTIKVDQAGEVEDIHLTGLRCQKSYIKKRLPEEITTARKLWEQHEHLREKGFTMIITK